MKLASSSSPSEPQSAFHVSLAGSHEHVVSAALDDAVAKLKSVSSPRLPTQSRHPVALDPVMQLVESISASPTRRDAIKQLVGFLSSLCPSATVRGGIGKRRINHFYDSRLGWLGPESSLYQQAMINWETQQRRAEDPKVDGPCVVGRQQTLELHLPQTGDSGRCIVWIDGNSEAFAWLAETVRTLTAVLWSRPSRSLPKLALRMARRTTVLVSVVAIAVTLLAVWPVPYRVACTAKVETTGGRFIATPFEATLLQANVRPGDTVHAGQPLLVLDGRPLRLEREALEAEIGQVTKEHDVALATRRIADAQQAALRRQQLTRQLDLINDRLGRLEVVSPIDGVIVSGDLEKYVGSPLERGQTLIEVAALGKMAIEVEIPEHEIGYVGKGTETRVKIDAVGGPSIRMPLSELYPAAELRDDRNVFVGRIDLDNVDGKLRPGMRGEATAYGPLRPWIWSWLRSGIERVMWWVGY